MYPVVRHFNRTLVAWAMKKFRRLKGHKIRASRFLKGIAAKCPYLFVHWQRGMVVILLDGSGVNREVHAPFYDRPGVQFLRPTRQALYSVKLDIMTTIILMGYETRNLGFGLFRHFR